MDDMKEMMGHLTLEIIRAISFGARVASDADGQNLANLYLRLSRENEKLKARVEGMEGASEVEAEYAKDQQPRDTNTAESEGK